MLWGRTMAEETHVYGIRRKGKRHLAFVERKVGTATHLPFQNVVEIEEAAISHSEATARAEAMVLAFQKKRQEIQWAKDKAGAAAQRAMALAANLAVSGKPDDDVVIPLVPGTMATHSDSEGQHYAMILSIEDDQATALFLTSSVWGGCRPASVSECYLFGVSKPKKSYLVKVVRPLRDFCIPSTVVETEVLSRYLKEFSP